MCQNAQKTNYNSLKPIQFHFDVKVVKFEWVERIYTENLSRISAEKKTFHVSYIINIITPFINYSIDYIFYSARNKKTMKLFVKELGELSINF